jgi:hypothetical protein
MGEPAIAAELPHQIAASGVETAVPAAISAASSAAMRGRKV